MLTLLFLVALAVFYWFPVRHWFRTWGSSADELIRIMPGDREVERPTYATNLAVTVDAPPGDVWPWLVQMGYRRGGLYSYDWLDRLFGYLDAPSADRVLPEHQHLEVGDQIPVGRGQGFPVTAIEPLRALVLGGHGDGDFAWVWQFGLYPVGDGHTRLVSRNRVRAPRSMGAWFFMRVIEPAAFLMTRRMLLGIRQRAEALSAHGAHAHGAIPIMKGNVIL